MCLPPPPRTALWGIPQAVVQTNPPYIPLGSSLKEIPGQDIRAAELPPGDGLVALRALHRHRVPRGRGLGTRHF